MSNVDSFHRVFGVKSVCIPKWLWSMYGKLWFRKFHLWFVKFEFLQSRSMKLQLQLGFPES